MQLMLTMLSCGQLLLVLVLLLLLLVLLLLQECSPLVMTADLRTMWVRVLALDPLGRELDCLHLSQVW
jgi:hypothetical protein